MKRGFVDTVAKISVEGDETKIPIIELDLMFYKTMS